MKQTLKNHVLLLVTGSLSVVAYVYLAVSSQSYGDAYLWQLYTVSAVCAGLSFFTWYHYWCKQAKVPLVGLLGFAILFRIIGFVTFPILEDDMYRFLWDGYMAVELGSPYGFMPAMFFESLQISDTFAEILGQINNPDIATIYGPVCQWLFALSYLIAPGEIWPLKLILGLADLSLIFILLKLANQNYVLLYAWSPLIIKEFVVSAHPDVLGVMFLMMAFLCYQRRNFIWMGVLLGLAAGIKLFALMLVPLLLGFQLRAWVAFIVTIFLVALPWGFSNAWLPTGLSAMSGNEWLFNAPLYLMLQYWVPIANLKFILFAALATGCAIYYFYKMRRWQQVIVRGDLLFAALFICIPALNAWYLVWLLPFAVIYPSLWAWTASVSILLAYSTGINLENTDLRSYQHSVGIVIIEFLVIVLAVFAQQKLKNILQKLR